MVFLFVFLNLKENKCSKNILTDIDTDGRTK